MKKILVKILLALNILAILLLVFSYLSVNIPPDRWWIPFLIGLAYPVLLLVNVVFVLLWLVFSPKYMLLSLVTILLGWNFLTRYLQLNEKNVEKGDVKVLSFNVMHFQGRGPGADKQAAREITDFLEQQNADIICLQEVRLRQNEIFNVGQIVADLPFIHHYQYARSSNTFGSVTMTRFPIIKMGEIRFENSRNISIFTDLVANGDTIRVFNIHLQSYKIDPRRYSFIESQSMDEEREFNELREVGMKMKEAVQTRAEQVKTIRSYMDNSPYPVIICGDFNDPPASFSYTELKRGLDDAFVSSGSGIGRTYVGKLPSFRIDFILHSRDFKSFNFNTHDFFISDHLPVSAELVKIN